MVLSDIAPHIANELSIKSQQVDAVVRLLDEGNTVPFIARYRKEVTGELDEEKIRLIEERIQYLRNLVKRQEEITASITEQGKLTDELRSAIMATTKLQELEDLYLPFRPKKRTRAQIARERGLEPLAEVMMAQALTTGDPLTVAAAYINDEVDTAQAALAGAMDIIAESISERADFRAQLRKQLWNKAELEAELAVPETEANEVLMYKEYREPVNRMPSHRILAVNRGEKKGLLKVKLTTPHDLHISTISRQLITQPSIFTELVTAAIADGYKRLLYPSLERELRAQLTDTAEQQAIRVFGLNLRQLLLQAPLAGHNVMGLDPGFRTGCKLAVVSPTGAVLETATIYITHSQDQRQRAAQTVLSAITKHQVSLISIGNGTASFETEEFVAALIGEHNLAVHYLITNEAGASVYSASKLAKDELPTLDVTLRGAVSIARRIQDPLAELVKIDPKSIGVGQYQHDVDQKELTNTLTQVVESAVNHVGVELNTASAALLTYVAGVSASVAKNIIAYRDANQRFKNRRELLKVARLGPAAFTQCAGFLRLQHSENVLDNTPVHPESYELAAAILAEFNFSVADLKNKERLQLLQQQLATADTAQVAAKLNAGEPTVRDIIAALVKPGRDPREDLPLPLTRKQALKLTDIMPGTIVKGTVHNVVDFGVFVDIGIKVNGLIHRSELSDKPIRHPLDAVAVGDIIECVVLSVDEARNRIGLSLKQAKAMAATN